MIDFLRKIFEFLTNRLFVLLIVICGLFYILLNQLFQLQIEQGETLESEFSLSIIRSREIESQRGGIYDRNGYPLAENIISYKVLLDGSILVEDKNKMILQLTNIIEKNGDIIISSFPIDYDEDGSIVYTESDYSILQFKKNTFIFYTGDELSDEERNYTAKEMLDYYIDYFGLNDEDSVYTDEEIIKILKIRYPLWLKRYYQFQLETVSVNISSNTLAEIEENIELFPGVTIMEDPQRYYNYPEYFAHIIGYTGKIDADTYSELSTSGYEIDDVVGKIGIEKEMELHLKGIDGAELIEVDNLGRTMEVLETQYPESGKDVYLTIDKDLQVMCYDILENKLADILQSKLSFNESISTDGDKGVTLMKDVFDSLFSSGKVSIDMIEGAEIDTGQFRIFTTFLDRYSDLIKKIEYSFDANDRRYDEELMDYYNYFLEKLDAQGYLKEDYLSSEYYTYFNAGEIGFYDLINNLITAELLIGNQDIEKADIRAFIFDKIINEYVNNFSAQKMFYLELIDEEAFNYYDLCLLLIEQGVVSADEEIISDFNRQKGNIIEFMQEKISNLEITPQDLALDPYSGSIVITDVNTGEVLALVSYPSYDNNMLVNDFNYDYYSTLLNDSTSPLFPRATNTKIAPGSTFKMLSAIAGLEEGVFTTDEKFYATGYFDKIYPAAKCWIYSKGGSHGLIDVSEALEVSCNHYFYELGYRLSLDENGNYIDIKGIETLKEYAQKLGLSGSTGIEIGDSYKNSASEQYAVRSAIGQGTNNYTPVQLARYISTIANEGTTYELNLIDKILYSDGDLYFDKSPSITYENEFKQENIDAVKKGMYDVINGSKGTASYYFQDIPIEVAGKTGTAQQINSRPSHGVFTGFTTYDNPEISVVCLIPFGYGSKYPTEMARTVIEAYYDIDYDDNNMTYELSNILDE